MRVASGYRARAIAAPNRAIEIAARNPTEKNDDPQIPQISQIRRDGDKERLSEERAIDSTLFNSIFTSYLSSNL
jgi:hypothetical protein